MKQIMFAGRPDARFCNVTWQTAHGNRHNERSCSEYFVTFSVFDCLLFDSLLACRQLNATYLSVGLNTSL